jgi:hypothetical protein
MVFFWNVCLCYSLQMEKLMVEVIISLNVLCGGSREGSILSLWVFVGGFHSYGHVGHLLTVCVTIPDRICCYLVKNQISI